MVRETETETENSVLSAWLDEDDERRFHSNMLKLPEKKTSFRLSLSILYFLIYLPLFAPYFSCLLYLFSGLCLLFNINSLSLSSLPHSFVFFSHFCNFFLPDFQKFLFFLLIFFYYLPQLIPFFTYFKFSFSLQLILCDICLFSSLLLFFFFSKSTFWYFCILHSYFYNIFAFLFHSFYLSFCFPSLHTSIVNICTIRLKQSEFGHKRQKQLLYIWCFTNIFLLSIYIKVCACVSKCKRLSIYL